MPSRSTIGYTCIAGVLAVVAALAYDAMANCWRTPAIMVESTAGGFSYRNVPVRIVALRSNAVRLEAILAGLGPLPETRLTLVPGRAPEGAVGNASTR